MDLASAHYTTRHIPSLERIFQRLAAVTIKKLDRPSRTLGALRLRGFLVVALLLPGAFFAGLFINNLMLLHPVAFLVAIAALMPIIGQKTGLEQVIEAGQLLTDKKGQSGDPHHDVRKAGATAVLDFSLKLVPRTLWWSLGGFALLLPLLLLNTLMAEAEKRRSGYAESPFFITAAFLNEFAVAPLSFLAALLLALAHFFLPGTNLGVFKAFHPDMIYGPVSRFFPLNVIAVGLGLSVEAEIGERTGSRKLSDKDILWIGPEDGRAKFTNADLKKIWHISLIAFAFYLVVAAMIFSLLLLNIAAE